MGTGGPEIADTESMPHPTNFDANEGNRDLTAAVRAPDLVFDLRACEGCDALLTIPSQGSSNWYCPRCRGIVHRARPVGPDTALALYLAALCFLVLANLCPIVAIEAAGNKVNTTLLGAAHALWVQHMNSVALLVAATTIVIPAIDLACTTWLLLVARYRPIAPAAAFLARLRERLRPWNMVEIFLLGSLVAIVKLGALASVLPGAGLWCLIAFVICGAAAAHAFDPSALWNPTRARS